MTPVPRTFVAAHVSRIYGPVQALEGWLARRGAAFTLVALPFSYSGMPRAEERTYAEGACVGTRAGHAAKGWDPVLWVRDWLWVLRRGWAAGAEAPVELFVGVDGLNATAGLVLRLFGRVRRVAFYVIDYTPKRFANPALNAVYRLVDFTAARGSDEVWNLSERMRAVRRAQGVAEAANRLVPVGVELAAVRRFPEAERVPRSLLYMGALMRGKGLELMVEAFPAVRERVPGAEWHIFGFGPFEPELKALVQASPARDAIHFHGGLDHDALFREVPRYAVALAPYLDDPGSYTWWCDPTKPKEYLACGLPLILTKVPWIWERVADPDRPMGLAIEYRLDALVDACVRLLGDDAFREACRANALAFAAGLDWDRVYRDAFGLGEAA